MSSSRLPSSFDNDTAFYEESRFQKFRRRLVEEPLIPLGCALTCYALFRASRSMRAGDHHSTNRMFRARIYAQAFTILCMVGGSYYYAEERKKRKVFDETVAERKSMERKEAWIRELEIRDQEEKALQAKKDAVAKTRAEKLAKSALETADTRRLGVIEAVKDLPWS